MSRFQELMKQFRLELTCLKYSQSTIDTYSSCLAVFLRAMNGKPKPLPFNEIKQFLAGITNQNYHKQFTATIRHFFPLVHFSNHFIHDLRKLANLYSILKSA